MPAETLIFQNFDWGSMDAHVPDESEPPDLGGRPLAIDDAELLNNRDCWIGLLSNVWPEIGWPLSRARSREDIRKVFASIRNAAAHELLLLAPLVRDTSIEATASEIRVTRNELEALREHEHELVYDRYTPRSQTLTERVRESKDALRAAWRSGDPRRTELRAEHLRRADDLAKFRKECKEVRQRCAALERALTEQEASFAQHELCAFIHKGKYAYSPRRLAEALAGLPYVGANQSYRRCSRHLESPLWPPFHFRVFELIEKAWKQRTNRSKSAFLKRIEKRVQTMRTTHADGDPDHHAIGVQSHFVENWWYLKEAIKAIDILRVVPGSVPYLIAGDFRKRVAQTTPTERVVASVKQLQPAVVARQKHRRNRSKY